MLSLNQEEVLKMNENIRNVLCDIFFKNYQDNINPKETLKEHYASLKKEDFNNILGIYTLIKDDIEVLAEVPLDEESTIEEMQDYTLTNLEEIYMTILSALSESIITQLSIFIKKSCYYKGSIHDDDFIYSIDFITKLYQLRLGKVNYNKDTRNIEFYIPKELFKLISKIIKNKQFQKTNEEINAISNYTDKILSAYGIISLNKLHEIINKVFIKIDKEDLETMLRKISICFNEINYFGDEGDVIIANSSFEEEDEAYTFYNSLSDGEYKVFTKEEYDLLGEDAYHLNFKAYDELMEYLNYEADLTNEQIALIETEIIIDYLKSYQQDTELANKNLMSKLNGNFSSLKIQDKAIIKKKLSNLGKLYPIYTLKGYAIEEEKIKDNILYEL